MLLSPIISPLSRLHRWFGVGAVQLGARSPINLRRLLLVPRQANAKTVSLVARGCLALWRAGAGDVWRERAAAALEWLAASRSKHPEDRACWGYPFPWRSILLYLPSGSPSGVCTVFAAEAMLDAYHTTGEERWLALARSACDFILRDLPRVRHDGTACISYIPGHDVSVHNANMLAAALLCRVYAITGEESLLEPVPSAVAYTLRDQNPDGSWFYDGPPDRPREMIDNYHTLFVLERLLDTEPYAGTDVREAFRRGAEFWRRKMVGEDGHPVRKYGKTEPVDIRDVASSLLWLSDPRLGADWGMWEKVLAWTDSHMLTSRGHYAFTHGSSRLRSLRHYYPRMQAWMFLALACAAERRR
jgi:hypothetical protein